MATSAIPDSCGHWSPSRRAILGTAGLLFAWGLAPRVARAAGRDPRLLVVVLRGGLDGLSFAPPIGDPAYRDLRGTIALGLDGEKPALPLDGFFALHPAMPGLHRLYQDRQALIVHAAATPYRERSHFDGQDMLESGTERPGFHDNGWLNRALSTLPGDALRRPPLIGVGPIVPLVARGAAPVMAWQPQSLPPAGDDLTRRLMDLYRHTDPQLAEVLARRVDPEIGRAASEAARRQSAYVVQALTGAVRFLARPDGPRIGALALDGFDTHANEGGATGQLANRLAAIDEALGEGQDPAGRCLARDGHRLRHRVRPHRPHQRHRGHRPRHRHGDAHGRRRGAWRTGHCRLAGPCPRQSPRGPRPQTHDRSPRRAEGPAPRSCRRGYAQAGRDGVSGEYWGQADGWAGGGVRSDTSPP